MTRRKASLLQACLLVVLAFGASGDAHATLIVDRGLPGQNLNDAAGGDRSNIAWGFTGEFLAGDDFLLRALDPGNRKWQIDRLTVWTTGAEATLGERFGSIKLFLGADGANTPAVASANLTGNDTGNSNVLVSQVNYPGSSESYQIPEAGFLNLWQIDFFNLGAFDPGMHLFALGGVSAVDPMPIAFNHASNAALSGTPQDGSDDLYRWFSGSALDASVAAGGFFDSEVDGWDKSSDINIRVYATQVPEQIQVPEPSMLGLMGLGLLGVVLGRRRAMCA